MINAKLLQLAINALAASPFVHPMLFFGDGDRNAGTLALKINISSELVTFAPKQNGQLSILLQLINNPLDPYDQQYHSPGFNWLQGANHLGTLAETLIAKAKTGIPDKDVQRIADIEVNNDPRGRHLVTVESEQKVVGGHYLMRLYLRNLSKMPSPDTYEGTFFPVESLPSNIIWSHVWLAKVAKRHAEDPALPFEELTIEHDPL